MYKLIFLLFLPLAANASPCLIDQGDSDANGVVNINELNYIKAKLGLTAAAADVAPVPPACDGIVNINDVNRIKFLLGTTTVWKTVGGNSYSIIECTPAPCDVWMTGAGGQGEFNWLATGGNTQLGSVGANLDCTPLTYIPDHRIYQENTGSGHPSTPTSDLANYFWGTSTSGTNPTYYTYCYLYSHSP